MKKLLSRLILMTVSVVWAGADDAPTVQVAPSDQVRYPDASAVLNKTDVKVAKPLPTTAPLLGDTPVKAAPLPAAPTLAKSADLTHGWFLRWILSGDEAGVLAWTQTLCLPIGARIRAQADGTWEVLAGPIDAAAWKDALKGQAGLAVLVKL